MVSVQQKVALVTGAARHIGREIALAMAGRGWDVVVHFRTSEAEALKTVNDIEPARAPCGGALLRPARCGRGPIIVATGDRGVGAGFLRRQQCLAI